MTGCAFRLDEQLETFPETIEQELRPAVCERGQTDRFKENYSIDNYTVQHHEQRCYRNCAIERKKIVLFNCQPAVIRPAMLYGTETWATTKRQEKRIEVTEMKILRWMCGQERERTHPRNNEWRRLPKRSPRED